MFQYSRSMFGDFNIINLKANKMKVFQIFCICTILLSAVCAGCHNNQKNAEPKQGEMDAIIVPGNEAPIHVIYNQRCNGYHVSMDFVRDGEEENRGSATFTFQKLQHSFSVNCDMFVLPKEAVEKDIDTIRLDYVSPAPDEYLSDKSPFYFKDMDFDGEEELVITGSHCSWYGSNQYEVFKVFNRDTPIRMVGEPFEWSGQPMSDRWTKYIPNERSIMCWFSSGTRLVRRATFQAVKDEKGKHELKLMKDESWE